MKVYSVNLDIWSGESHMVCLIVIGAGWKASISPLPSVVKGMTGKKTQKRLIYFEIPTKYSSESKQASTNAFLVENENYCKS